MAEKENITFAEYAEKVLFIKKHKVRHNTYQLHWKTIIYNHLNPYFGGYQMCEICKNDIELYFIENRSLAKSTLKSHLVVLSEIFASAYDNDVIVKNPCKHFKLDVGGKSATKSVYTPEQTEMILNFCKIHRFGLDIDLLLRSGISRSELLGIRWQDIDLNDKTISIHTGVTNAQGAQGDYSGSRVVINDTKNKFRTRKIAICDETADLILKHPQKLIIGRNVHKHIDGHVVYPEFLIYNKFGNICAPDTWYKRHYKAFMKDMHEYYLKQGIDIPIRSPHELRHTRASIWVNEGKNPYAIAAQMGWANFEMLSKVYGHRDMNQLRKQLGI
jgi:integrase